MDADKEPWDNVGSGTIEDLSDELEWDREERYYRSVDDYRSDGPPFDAATATGMYDHW